MLQPRSCRIACVLLVVLVTGLAEDPLQEDDVKERVKRENGDVTVLSLEEIARLKDPPVGVLSSTARTFVTGGATTEYATQILGTTIGRTYARLLSTGSRVFYDNVKPSKDPTPYLVFPTLPAILNPSPVDSAPTLPTQQPELVEAITGQPLLNEITESSEAPTSPKPVVSIRKEFSVKKNSNSEVKPAKVKPNSDLPTVTIKAEFAPSGYSDPLVEERRDKKLRTGKGLFRGGVQIKNDLQKYDTITYVGFADFTTTVGNTVIVFMPKTAVGNSGPVTSIAGAATLRPEDAIATTVKTFLSHSPGMATQTFTGNISPVHKTLPTVQADRASKAYNPVYVTTEEMAESTENGAVSGKTTSTESQPVTEDFTTERTTGLSSLETVEQELKKDQATTEVTAEMDDPTTPEGSEVPLPNEEVKPTEALKITPTFATSTTKVFIPGDKPLGLAKSVSAVEAYDDTTTHFTSFLFGTIVDGEYTQLTQVVSSVALPPTIAPTPVVTNLLKTAKPAEPSESTSESEEATEVDTEKPSVKLITKLVPATIHQTYTYLTTFFVPSGDTTTTSIRTREVVSDEIRYVATVIPENLQTVSSGKITPSDVTQNYQTATPLEPTTEVTTSEQPTPELPDTTVTGVTQEITKAESTTLEGTTAEPEAKSLKSSVEEEREKEEEVEVIIRTLYTTYTYLTTFFQESTTSVQSREIVETNVVTSTLDTASIPEATDPAVAGLFSPSSASASTETVASAAIERPPGNEKIFLKTYTYYTTVYVDGETIIESKTEVVRETIQPTSTMTSQIYKTVTLDDNSVVPKDLAGAESSDESSSQMKKLSYGTVSRPKINDLPSSEALIMPHPLQSSIDDGYSYDTTMSPTDRISSTKAADYEDEMEVEAAREEELKKEYMQAIGITTTEDEALTETLVTDITSSSSGGSAKRKAFEEYESDPNDQISSESNTEEIEPSFSPTILLQTSYTTFTYFTTVYKGTTSDIISRLETVTNVVTETVKPTEIEPKLSPEEATLPITYFTTFTYWTTLYRGKNTMITSREETVSNVVTPTLDSELTSGIEMTESPVSLSSIAESITPTVTPEASTFTVSAIPTEIIATPIEASEPATELSPTEVALEPTTYYTTYTYFTTSYIGNETVINSHLETETNIETPTKSASVEVTESILTSKLESNEATPSLLTTSTVQPTGLISTIRSSVINDGITTLLNTDVYGTYIDGLYAQVLESSSEILAPSQASSIENVQPTGVVSINEGKIVDANGITTTLFTTKAIGTYIDALYAQVLESTSSVVVDEVRKTELPAEIESTTVVGTKVYTTGLVRLIEGSIVKGHTTTFYESRVIGTLIDGRYAQIIESTSSFKADVSSTAGVSPSSTTPPGSVISPTASITTASPAVIEGSQGTEDDEDRDGDDEDNGRSRLGFNQKKKTFTPVIRPFSSRPRPTFQPKKKTGDPATTITRTSFTPTVTATPASKTGFGSSRNRFAANRSKASSNQIEIKPTASSSRRFSRPRSSSAVSFGSGSSSAVERGTPAFGRGRSSAKVQPTATPSTSARRGGFNYRSTGRPNLVIPSSSRGRIRPTGVNRFGTPSVPVDDINNNDINGGAAAVTEEVEHNTASEEEEEEEAVTSPATTTESARRANNPLLRFRRPPILQRTQSSTTTTPKPSTTPKRSPSLLRRPDSRSGPSITTTPRSRPTVNFNRNKPRPASNLFPSRGLARKPVQEEIEEEKEELEEDVGEEIEDNEYEGSETAEQTSSTTTEAPKSRRTSKALGGVVQIRPFTRRPRTKRQADYGTRAYSARYRRPTARVSYDYEEDYVQEPVREVTRQPTSRGYSSRSRNQAAQVREYTPREAQTYTRDSYARDLQTYSRDLQPYSRDTQTTQSRVRPSPVPSTPRHPFTLRERTSPQTTTISSRSNFRRPTSSPRRRGSTDLTTQSQRLSRPATRHRTVTTEAPTSHSRSTSRRYNSQQQSRRTTARSRYRDSNEFDVFSPKPFDGTITVTHRVPTEVTIPVINGKNTEYKPVITAKPSLEVLDPYQYSSTIGKDGKSTIILNSDVTSTLPNGIMEVTKFLVFETPTTSITFTPTTLRGRKTSFSHVLPSTVYEVRPEVSTVQPNLGDNPFANILLSQLLLGNLAQPTGVPGQPATPVTEYKTKTTTYVTTVTSHTSTVLPLTFRGKEITTTIVDSSVHVITATEYLTETVVVTPTAVLQPAVNQLNTLLLPALLPALLNQQTSNPLTKSLPLKPLDDLYNNDRPYDDDDTIERLNRQKDEVGDEDRKVRESVETDQDVEQKPSRKKSKIKQKEKDKAGASSSVITLYVSGKHPGEFTTLLSTVPIKDENSGNVKKREISLASLSLEEFKIKASKTPELGSSYSDEISNYILPVFDGFNIESSEMETVSAGSDTSEISKYLDFSKSVNPEIVSKAIAEENSESRTGHFLLVGHADSAPDQRKATPRSYPFSLRVKRDTSPVRRVIRVRIPVRKAKEHVDTEKDYYVGAASSHGEETFDDPLDSVVTEGNEKKVKKVLVARRKPVEDHEPKRKRILVTKRRPIHIEEDDTEALVKESITPTSTRRRVLKTRKRLLATEEEPAEIEPVSKKRITVTRRRPVHTDSPNSIDPYGEMQTLYNYHYSIPGQGAGSSVMVSEIFMSGNDHAKMPKELEFDADFKELMEGMSPSVSSQNAQNGVDQLNNGKSGPDQTNVPTESALENEPPLTTWKPKTTQPPNSESGRHSLHSEEEPLSHGDQDGQEYHEEIGEDQIEFPDSPYNPSEDDDYYDDVEEQKIINDYNNSQKEEESEDGEFELNPSYVTLFPYDTTDVDSPAESSSSSDVTIFPYDDPKSETVSVTSSDVTIFPYDVLPTSASGSDVTLFPYDTPEVDSQTKLSTSSDVTLFPYDAPEVSPTTTTSVFNTINPAAARSESDAESNTEQDLLSTSGEPSTTVSTTPTTPIPDPEANPTSDFTSEPTSDSSINTTPDPELELPTEPSPPETPEQATLAPVVVTEYQTVTKEVTSTRFRTYTYVVTRVSGDEQFVTSSTTVKPDIKTTTVTELLPVTSTLSAKPSSIGGRGLYVIEPRHNLATKVMANGVEVIVAGGKSTLPGAPQVRVIPTGLARPITLAPSTLTDHMMMILPHESQKPQKDFVTNTYYTTFTYPADDGTSTREKVVVNRVTEEAGTTRTQLGHFSLASTPVLTSGVYHTTYTYLNTLVDGERPLVITSKKTIANTKTDVASPSQAAPKPVPQHTNTYFSTMAFSKTLNDGDRTNVVKTEDVVTQVVITEADYLPSALPQKIRPTAMTTDVTKTYFATYTYFNTKVVDGSTVVKTEIATSSDVVTETFTIQPKKTSREPEVEPTPTNSINLYATKTYLTTFTYFTTLLQDNKSPSTIVKSRTKVQQNIVTEMVDDGLIDPDYLNILKSSVNSKHDSVVATATLSNGNKMEITAVASKLVSPTQELGSSIGNTPSNVVTGSTIIFFDDDVEPTPALESSFAEASTEYAALTRTPTLITSTPVQSNHRPLNTKISSPEEGDESLLVEMAADPASSGGSSPVNNIFQGLNALGPVINAMADLFGNNYNKKKNESIGPPIPQAFLYQRPVSTGNGGNKPQISPVYVPSHDSDSETAESQHIGGVNVFLDIHQRTKQGVERPSIEEALLSGGIPISPGQVITTNSDVIIGKHAVHGPRPPQNKLYGKNDLVEGMKPPPPPPPPPPAPTAPTPEAPAVASVPQKSSPKPSWPPRDQERYPSVVVPQRVPPPQHSQHRPQQQGQQRPLQQQIQQRPQQQVQQRPSLQDAPPLVPPPIRPQFVHHQKHQKPSYSEHSGEPKYSLQIDPPKETLAKPHKYPKNPPYQRIPHHPPQIEHQDPPPTYNPEIYKHEKNRYQPKQPVVTINREDHNSHINMSVQHQVNAIGLESFSTTPAVDQTLLVNIQPSQVANVVIPHGLSTALIYSGSSEMPSQKGEIINDPSPYPDAEVGMVGVAGLSTSSGEATIPSNAVRLDVAVSPQAVDIPSLKRPNPTIPGRYRPQNQQPPQNLRPSHGNLEYLGPPPPPPTPQISSYVNYHLPKEPVDDQEGDYSIHNEYHTSSEEVKTTSQQTHKVRPQWGTKVTSGLVLPNQPTPFKYLNYSNGGLSGVQYSVINSKPVHLSQEGTEKQPPIVKGKPGVTNFANTDEATVSVGQPTNLAPADELPTIPTALSKQDNPSIPPPTSYDFKWEKPIQNKQNLKQKPQGKPIDNIKNAMNLDERPPAPTFETPSLYEVQTTMDSSLNGISVKDESVVGLTPPAPVVKLNPTIVKPTPERSTHRPVSERPTFRPSRRPFPTRKRPTQPYKFEVPQSTAATKVKKPVYQEPRPTVPSGTLSPPKLSDAYPGNEGHRYKNDTRHYTSNSVIINPVLGGSLKVEELPHKPEVITADVKIPVSNDVLPPRTPYQETQPSQNVHTPYRETNPSPNSQQPYREYPSQQSVHEPHREKPSSHNSPAPTRGTPPSQKTQNPYRETGGQTTPSVPNNVPYGSTMMSPPNVFSFNVINDNSYSGSQNEAHKVKPSAGSQTFNRVRPPVKNDGSNGHFGMEMPSVQPTQDKPIHFTESDSISSSSVRKTNKIPTGQSVPAPSPTTPLRPQEINQIIGSEVPYPLDESTAATQPMNAHQSNVNQHFHEASTANMIKVTTGPTTHSYVTPVRNIEKGHSVVPLQLTNRTDVRNDRQPQEIPTKPTTYVVTHTKTLTVTTTESRIIQSKGQKPSTHTLVVTQTHTSTVLDTVTEVHTLVKPTSIVSTVTTTIPQATTTIFPTSVASSVEPTQNVAPPKNTPPPKQSSDEDTILVVMTDKNSKNTLPHMNIDTNEEPPLEIEAPSEEDEVNPNVLLSGLLGTSETAEQGCNPGCKASRNELCQKIDGILTCVCRPGFARMFAERPCKPTYTFSMQVPLERVGWEKVRYSDELREPNSGVYQHLAEATKTGLDRMVMQSDLRDVYHGLAITGFERNSSHNDTMAKFYIQLSENTDESKLEEVFRKHLKTNNFSMGGTELHASKEKLEFLRADDFDECQNTKFHDCSENAQCFNLRGTYTCSCKEGFTDLSHNTLYPGRICSAEMIGCERCNFHGNCYPRESEEDLCECFQWYAGQYCQINLKVLLLILSLVGISLVVLLVVCLVLSCMRRRPLSGRGASLTAAQLRPPGFRIRPHQPQDKRAMISLDTSSEASIEPSPPPYLKQAAALTSQVARPQKPCRKQSKAPSPPISYGGTMEQRDRSLTVMIPRAKYRPVPVQGSNLTMSTFGPEQKLLKYLTVEKPQGSRSTSRKPSNSTTNSQDVSSPPKKLPHAQPPPPRKPSTGALVSAGFEVSATVGRTKEIHECFIGEPHTDLNQAGFSTIRTADSSVFVDVPPPPTLEAELLDSSRVDDYLTVSEARSYDETLIHPPTKCLRSGIYTRDGSEGHTMVERDTGSTFVLPQNQLYKPDRGNGSDISNFDSL